MSCQVHIMPKPSPTRSGSTNPDRGAPPSTQRLRFGNHIRPASSSRFSLAAAIGEEVNLWLRVVDDDVWPFDASDEAQTVTVRCSVAILTP